jgi:hypothetical protein
VLVAAATDTYRTRFLKVSDPEQLYEKNVICHRIITNQVAPYSPFIYEFELDSDNYKDAIDELKDGKVEAIIHDRNVLRSWASDDCNLFVVGPTFGHYSLSVRFPADVDRHLMDIVNKSLLWVHETIDVERIKEEVTSIGDCDNDWYIVSSVTLDTVGGLWIVWGICVITVFILRWMLKRTILVTHRKRHVQQIRQIANRPETRILKNTE